MRAWPAEYTSRWVDDSEERSARRTSRGTEQTDQTETAKTNVWTPKIGNEVAYRISSRGPMGDFQWENWSGHILNERILGTEKLFLIERKDAIGGTAAMCGTGIVTLHDYVPASDCQLMSKGRGD